MKKLIALGVAAAMAMSLAACGGSSSSAAASGAGSAGTGNASGETLTLKLGHVFSTTDLINQGALQFADKVNELSGGTIVVEVYDSSTLGGDTDLAEGMQMGTVDMALIAGVLANFEPSINLLEMPYLFDSAEEFRAVVTEGDVGATMASNLESGSGIKILNWWERGWRVVSSNKPINTLADLSGMKLRVPQIDALQQGFTALGASPVTLALSDVYTSVQEGVIDGQENPIPTFYANSFQEINKYLCLSNHKYEYVTLDIASNVYNKLTDEQKGWIEEAGEYATEWYNTECAAEVDSISEELVNEDGVTITEPTDLDAWREAARSIADDYAASIGETELYEQIKTILGR